MDEHDDNPEELDEVELGDYEVVAYGVGVDRAEEIRELLIDHEIDAVLEEDEEGAYVISEEGVAVLVPVEAADEARDVIGELESIEDFDSVDPDEEDDLDEDDEETTSLHPLEDDDDSLYLDEDDEEVEGDDEL